MKNWKFVDVGNKNVGNGSGSWRGKFYEDSAGNSASVEKRGEGWEVYWEDARGYGKPLGTYKDERTAREVAEDAVESEMPDKIRANYKSKAINRKLGNESIDKQEWSMFSGLKKDAEKEIGNAFDPGIRLTIRHNGKEEEVKVLKDMPTSILVKGQSGAVVEIKKTDFEVVKANNTKKTMNRVGKLFTEEERARIALGRYEEAKKRGYGVDYEKKLAKEEIQTLEKIAKGGAKYIGFEEKDIPDAKRAIEIYKKIVSNKKTTNDFLSDHIKIVGIPDPDTSKEPVDNLKRARNAMNKKIGNLDTVEEGDYVTVRFQGELVDGVVRKVQGTQALVTIDGTDMWFPIRSLKEST